MKPTKPISKPNLQIQEAVALHLSGRLAEAVDQMRKLLIFYPKNVQLLTHLGSIYIQQGQNEQGINTLGKSLQIESRQPMALFNRAMAFQKLKRLEEALASYEQVIALEPNRSEAYNNRGNLLRKLNRLEEALASYDRAIAIKPDYPEAHNNRGTVLQELKRLDEAVGAHERAVELKPAYIEAYFNLALLELLKGDYLEGWKLYQWRESQRNFTQPLWTGIEPLENKTILVHAEHGYGDVIQYCRYARLLGKRGAKVIFEVPGSLVEIVSSMGNLTVVGTGQPLSAFDFYCPMMSLPMVFKTTVKTIPSENPYLLSDANKKAEWQKKLGTKTMPRVGLAWSGNQEHTNDHNRSIPLETLKPLLELPFEFHSLQKEYKQKDRMFLADLPKLRDHHRKLTDFSETAAVMDEMDLIISVDTSAAHLAGALGKPVWILLPFVPDYRWLLDRSDSPWYPTAVLLRQPQNGNWKAVIEEVVKRIQSQFP
jgi:tetratricopeptide (TPR) repeat protein